MTEQGYKRKLTAILSADVEDYSRLMGDDESATIRTLTAYKTAMSTLVKQNRGRVVDAPGDNLLADFASVVDAVRCAVEIQQDLANKNTELPIARQMEFRIGINLGDVVEEEDRIYGDGVNITARIESLADGGGICVSGTVYDQIVSNLDLEYEFLGEKQVKNIERPIRVYRVLMRHRLNATSLDEEEITPSLPDIPSIAVLPLTNMSGDPGQDYFSDGLTEQIIAGLSKVANLLVIARNSTFAYKGRQVNIQQVGRELGVRYVLEGSVQRAENRVRITIQLNDSTTGFHIWTNTYDREIEDIFALQDEITNKVISAMEVNLTLGEQARLWEGAGTTNISAYDKYARALECSHRNTEQDNAQARKFAEEAISIDPEYTLPHVLLGFTYYKEGWHGWGKDPLSSMEKAERTAQNAAKMSDGIDSTHSLMGCVYLYNRQFEKAIEKGELAISLNPNGADAHRYLAFIYEYAGMPEKAINLMKRAMRLNPIPPASYYWVLGLAYRLTGQYTEAIEQCVKALHQSPSNIGAYIIITVSYILAGRDREARDAAKEILRIHPKFSVSRLGESVPYKNKTDTEVLIESLIKAGLK